MTSSPVSIDYGSAGRIGVLLPSVNQAAEPQLRAMLPANMSLSVTRLKLDSTDDKALLGMAHGVEQAASLLADAGVDVIVFHCTAVSTYSVELEQSIIDRIAAATALPVIATSRSLVAALKAVDARRIVMVSPYPEVVDKREAAYFKAHGFEVLGYAGRGCANAKQMMAVTPEQWIDMVMANANEHADAYVLSCTTVRSAEAIEPLERALSRPVITSNSAVAWHSAQLLGRTTPIGGFGALLNRAPTRSSTVDAHQ